MKPGTRVSHPQYGTGTVIREWGAWRACLLCRDPVDGRSRCKVRDHNTHPATKERPWPHAHAFDVSGGDVVDVNFGEFGVHSLNVCRITEIPVVRAKRVIEQKLQVALKLVPD